MAKLFTLENELLRVQLTDYGGVIVRVETPDKNGDRGDVLLGFDAVESYAAAKGSFGAILGRTANRIGGARFTLDGVTHQLSKNEAGATLQGGIIGFGKRFWSVTLADSHRLKLHLTSRDGEEGFPGEIEAEALYELVGAELRLTFAAGTTKPTPLSLSAHPYFNLDGVDSPNCLDHELEIFATTFLPTDSSQIPTGELRAVGGSPFDFTKRRRIGERIRENEEQLRFGRGYDHCFVLPSHSAGLKLAARVHAARSGRTLEILTSQRGVQFYTGNNLDGSVAGRGGLYRQSAGFAFEPQGFPNAVNQPNFPSSILYPGQRYQEAIVYRFGVEGGKPDL